MSLRRRTTRSMRALSTSSLQPQSVASTSSQPTIRVVQPSPIVSRLLNKRALSQHSPPIPMASMDDNEVLSSPICSIDVSDNVNALLCDQCLTWYHSTCLFMTDTEYNKAKLKKFQVSGARQVNYLH